ncbi:MAG: hypothetical protein KDJ75_01730 [Alphaproteobacteria bacterium]|nr:hypothetical protein [Alphaproteobacteria bacterium]
MAENTLQIQIRFTDSSYLSRLYIDINSCLRHINEIHLAQDFSQAFQDDFLAFKTESKRENTLFGDKDDLQEIYKILFCQIWNSFVLYLKCLIFAAKIEKEPLSKNKFRKLQELEFDKIKEALETLRICPQKQPQWKELQIIKKQRDVITHSHETEGFMKALYFQDIQFTKKYKKISSQNLFEVSEYIINFSKKIDKEFLKNYPHFMKNLQE